MAQAAGQTRAGRWAVLLGVAGVVLFVAACGWAAADWRSWRPRGATWGVMGIYWAGYAAAWAGTLGAVGFGGRVGWSAKRAGAVILGVALLARVGAAMLPGPRLSDDLYRYVQDGATLARGVNPYAKTPAEVLRQAVRPEGGGDRRAGDFEKRTRGWRAARDGGRDRGSGLGAVVAVVVGVTERVNHPQLATIYQPAAEWVFAGISRAWELSPGWWRRFDARRVHTFRLVFSLLDVGLIGLMIGQLMRAGRPVWWACVYAWHPLVIGEVAWSGHEDVIGVVALLAAMMVASRAGGGRRGRGILAGALFAVAVAVKPIVLPVAVVGGWLLLDRARRAKAAGAIRDPGVALGVSILACMATGAVLYLPFAAMPGGLERMFATVHRFVGAWSFNPGVYALVAGGTGSAAAARWMAVVVSMLVMLWLLLVRRSAWLAALGYMFAALLLSSTVYPWYLLWCLALLPMAMSEAEGAGQWHWHWVAVGVGALVFSLTISLSYVSLVNASGFSVPTELRWAEYLPVLAAMAGWGWFAARARARARSARGTDQE